ncbi:MAG: 50S ribosomal protein L6 [Hyphomicrobiaceae bacterium]
MSRIGKKPVTVPANVTVTLAGQEIKVKGPKGELAFTAPESVKLARTDAGVEVSPVDDSKTARSMWGMTRSMIANLVTGVTEGYTRTLEIHGVGFRAALQGKDKIQMQVGFSHDVVHPIPSGVEVKVGGARQDQITITGIDKQLVGQLAAELRAYRKPEPYQGKGVRYQNEYIFRKEGKKK